MPSPESNGIRQRIERWPTALPLTWQILVLALTLLLIFSRRPSDLLHAQFYAEDGASWFGQAYDAPWQHSLFIPYAAYLQVLPRLIAALALTVPLVHAPLVMNLLGSLLQALPVTALLSSRCTTWGSLPLRALLAIFYIGTANAPEIHVNATNAQWHFGLLIVLLAFGVPPRSILGKAVDIFIFALASVSGPFGLALIPLILTHWFLRRETWGLVRAALLTLGGVIQVHMILSGNRLAELPLGANLERFIRILGADVFFNSFVGVSIRTTKLPLTLLAFVIAGAILLIACAWIWGPLSYRLFVIYGFTWLFAGLKAPVILFPLPRWQALILDVGMRYYFFPTIITLWAAVYCASRVPSRFIKYASYAALLLALVGDARKWEYAPYPDFHFVTYVEKLQHAPVGEHIVVPIDPAPWTMELIRH